MRTAMGKMAIVWALTATAAAQPPPPEATTPVRRLHAAMIKPASEVIFNVGRESPAGDRGWAGVSRAGATLVRAGTRLALAPPTQDRTAWIGLSRQLVAAGRAARAAAQTRSVTALSETSDRLLIVCESCHAPFRRPNPPS